ncbi:MAG: BlaI/MecI/CopY family transcriptional regulator [Bacteroidetes bacterium]|nr:BlaI/MecI/CopY family transcriptional regulator [Bacteroidota bacterium]
MKLSPAEEQLMKYLWELKLAYMKDLVEAFPEPRPAYTTIATLLKRMTDKGFVSFNQHGKVREYFPMVKKPAYFSGKINTIIRDFFNDSNTQFASFFANETNFSLDELEELKTIVEQQIKEQKK